MTQQYEIQFADVSLFNNNLNFDLKEDVRYARK